MGTELMRVCVKEENDEIPAVPPGFETYSSYTLKGVQDTDKHDNDLKSSCPASLSASASQPVQRETKIDASEKITRSLRRRPWINYGKYENCSDDESDSMKLDQNFTVQPRLSKGVIRGCPRCSDCQKVVARWHPEDARRPVIEDAPVFYPTDEEFEDTLKYIAKIRPKAEQYGICRIVPPSSWKPPCTLKNKSIWDGSKFATRVQRVDKLQNRHSVKKKSRMQNPTRRKRRRCMRMAVDCGSDSGNILGSGDGICHEDETFGFEPGPELSLSTFKKYADFFKAQYFSSNKNEFSGNMAAFQEQWEPSVESIEGEYWRIVERATEEIEVLYGADLETGVFGSGFPKIPSQLDSVSEERYIKSGWNLNNFPRLPGSVLTYESSDISGVLVPWLYVGMCFSSFCWHVEDHHLYSLNYMHWGAPKMWYGVPGKDALKLEQAMRKHLPDLFEEQPDLLHKLVTQLSPSILKSEGVPVYRCVQNAGEFVLTFPRAYHSGFNCGFNCAEAVNVAPVDWLPHGQIAIELYRRQRRKTSISHDKLLLGAAREAVKAHWERQFEKKTTLSNLRWKDFCGKDEILVKTLRTRIEVERATRNLVCSSSEAKKMDSNFDATSERECSICFFDLHLSAVGCKCSSDRYACLTHAKQLCSCAWASKYFLFRYDVAELDILVEAVEGKLSAVYRWARNDLGKSLTPSLSGDNMQMDNIFSSKAAKTFEEVKLQPEAAYKHLEVLSPSKDIKRSSISAYRCSPVNEVKSINFKIKKDELIHLASKVSTHVSQFPQAEEKCLLKKPSMNRIDNVIVLSDDEGDEPINSLPEKSAESSTKHSEASTKIPNSEDKADSCNYDKDSVGCTIEQGCKIDLNGSVDIETTDHTTPNVEGNLQHPSPSESGKPNTGVNHEKVETISPSNLGSNLRANTGNPSCSQNNLDRYFRQKGPRIAKVVRRINCNVEPLEYGVVLPGKSWCNSQAIFPKGFKSRVRYINVLDPMNMCNYVSEILDAGRDGPLFMVSLEQRPSEVFIHVSAARCWEMIRERLNFEIAKQHKLGRQNLPPLQPPGSLDGFEMFGFSSPAIVQTIEALDKNRVCTEYWDSRPYSRPQLQIPQTSQLIDNIGSSNKSAGEENNQDSPGNHPLPMGVDTILKSLFKKANPAELQSLRSILNENRPAADKSLLTQLLNEEIHNRPS